MSLSCSQPFDELAEEYDDQFTRSLIGGMMRKRVWDQLDQSYKRGGRILELNCGTGEDALHLARQGLTVDATDISAGMLNICNRKVENAGMTGQVSISRLAIEELKNWKPGYSYDGILSNFGGLNCVPDLAQTAAEFRDLCHPRARVFVCIMGPFVPLEWFWFIARRQPGKAFRRIRPGGQPWHGIRLYYPSPGSFCKSFSPYFKLEKKTALGALLPPPYMEPWAIRHPALIKKLNYWEQRLQHVFPFPWLSDHYLLEFSPRS